MDNESGGGGLFAILAGVGMALCCSLPLLLVSGSFGALMAWLLDGGLIWLALALILVAAVLLEWRRRNNSYRLNHEARHSRGVSGADVSHTKMSGD